MAVSKRVPTPVNDKNFLLINYSFVIIKLLVIRPWWAHALRSSDAFITPP